MVLSVHLSVCPSVVCLCTQKSGYLAIYRVKRLLNTTVTLKSKKKCPGVYLIVAKAVPFGVSTALSFLTTVHSAILIRSQLEYDRGRAYTDSGHVFILAIGHVFILAISHARPQIRILERCTLCVRIRSQRYTLRQLLHRPSLQSCQVQVVNYAPRGMSLLETSSSLQSLAVGVLLIFGLIRKSCLSVVFLL